MWNLLLKLAAKRLFPNTPFESLSRAQLQKITSEATKVMNRTKGQTAEIKDLPRGGIDNVPVNRQFTRGNLENFMDEMLSGHPRRSRQVFEVLDDDAYRGLQADTFRRLIANTDDDVKAFGKRIIENKQDVKFEKLTKDQRKGILDMVDDRIKMGNRKFMEKYDPKFPPDEDFASGGIARVGYGKGKLVTGFFEFIEGLFIKASNDIRLGKGKWAGLDQKQKMVQHDNLTKLVEQFQKTGKFDKKANEYFGIDAEKAFAGATKKVKSDDYLEALDKRIMDEMDLTKSEMDNMSSTALDDLRRNADPIGMQKHFDEITEGRGIGDFADDPNFLRDVTPVKTKKVDKDRLATADELEEYESILDPTGVTGDVGEGMTVGELDKMVADHKAYVANQYQRYKRGDLDKYVKPEVLEEQRLFRQKKIDKVLDKAYDEVFYQKPSSGDYKYDADVLSDSIAEQLGKGSFTDLPQTHQTQIYNTALKRVTQDMQMKRTLKDVEQKMQLSDFDIKGKKGHASGGIAGQLHLNEGGRVRYGSGSAAPNPNVLTPTGSFEDNLRSYFANKYAGEDQVMASAVTPEGDLETNLQDYFANKYAGKNQVTPTTITPEGDLEDNLLGYFENKYAGEGQVIPTTATPAGNLEDNLLSYYEDKYRGPALANVAPMEEKNLAAGALEAYQKEQEIAESPDIVAASVATPQKTVTRNPLVDPRMYRSYAENIQAMADPRMQPPMGVMAPRPTRSPDPGYFSNPNVSAANPGGYASEQEAIADLGIEKYNQMYAKGGRASLSNGGLAKILGV
jgi:hypothetical protein